MARRRAKKVVAADDALRRWSRPEKASEPLTEAAERIYEAAAGSVRDGHVVSPVSLLVERAQPMTLEEGFEAVVELVCKGWLESWPQGLRVVAGVVGGETVYVEGAEDDR